MAAMETEFLRRRVQELSDAFYLQHHGMNQMLEVLAKHGQLLEQIVEAVCSETDEEGELTKLLRRLVTIGDAHIQQQDLALTLLRQIKAATGG